MPAPYGDKTLAQITVFTFSRKRHLDLSIGAIHKGCPHIRGGRGVRQKWTNAERGRGWLAKRGRRLGKKIIATIFVKFTQIN